MGVYECVLEFFIDFVKNQLGFWVVIFILMGFCGQMLFNKR